MSKAIVYVNGNFYPIDSAVVSFRDGGFQFGDGLFETIRFDKGRIFLAEHHLERMRKGLEILDLKLEESNNAIISIFKKMIAYNQIESGLLRLMITRGEILGTPWSYKGKPGIYVSIRPMTPIPDQPVKVVYFDETDYPIIRFNPAIKSMNYIGNMKAKKDAEDKGAYEPIFYNKDKFITECAIRNIFYVKNNIILSPSLDLGVLPGVMRSTIIAIARKMNLEVQETYLSFNDVNDVDEAFISSTGIGLLPCYWTGWKSNYKITNNIANELTKHIEKLSK